jgi:hypothetical protein
VDPAETVEFEVADQYFALMPTQSTSAKADLRQLQFRLAATRARLLFTQMGAGFAAAASLAIGGLAAEMTLDGLVHLPWLARACFSLPALGGAGWIFYREVLLPVFRIPSDHAVACAIERAMPIFQTRLIASIQLSRDERTKKNALVGALIRETAATAAGQDFRKAVRNASLLRGIKLLACVLVASGGLAWLGRPNVTLLLERALLLTTRLPSRTRIEKIDCPAKIASGDDLKIEVQAAGVIPEEGLIVAQAGSRTSEYKLEPDAGGGGRFHALIRSVPDSLSFKVSLNDATSDPVAVQVFSPPAVMGIQALELFPAYTNLPPMARPTGDLSLLAGSILRLTVAASGPVKAGSVHLAGLETDAPLTVDAATRIEAHADIPIPKAGLTGFSIRLLDDNGIESRETAVYRIDIVPDLPPTVTLTHPGEEEAATATATELIAFHAEDDFGVARVFLHYIVNHGKEKVIEFDLGGTVPRQVYRRFDWNLAALKLAPGGLVEYWMEAVDANNVTGPGRGVTAVARIKIVTEDEKRTELAERLNDALGSLDEVSQSQDELARRLGTLIFQKPGAANP